MSHTMHCKWKRTMRRKKERKMTKAHRPAPCPRRKHGGVAATKTQKGFYFSRGESNPQPLSV
jgi:hypothetical protein